ncbi:MAG: hypothetical protein R2704_01860 [Microthrixaceae bacterium]|nr:hypothetical protein [Microthrixaceae bacterium]
MTLPNVTAPPRLGATGRQAAAATFERIARHRPSGPNRSVRDLTPLIFLAMILIPSLIVLGLAIADPGSAPVEPRIPQAVTAAPGS